MYFNKTDVKRRNTLGCLDHYAAPSSIHIEGNNVILNWWRKKTVLWYNWRRKSKMVFVMINALIIHHLPGQQSVLLSSGQSTGHSSSRHDNGRFRHIDVWYIDHVEVYHVEDVFYIPLVKSLNLIPATILRCCRFYFRPWKMCDNHKGVIPNNMLQMKFVGISCETRYKTPLMVNQRWFRSYRGAIAWANIDLDRHMVSQGHNELRYTNVVNFTK